MPATQNNAVMKWLYVFAFVVAFLVVFGGFVRLTRSGLSIVEWNPISGAPLEVTAEGIEDAPTMDALRGMGCQFGQGYLFGAAIEHPVYAWRELRAVAG